MRDDIPLLLTHGKWEEKIPICTIIADDLLNFSYAVSAHVGWVMVAGGSRPLVCFSWCLVVERLLISRQEPLVQVYFVHLIPA